VVRFHAALNLTLGLALMVSAVSTVMLPAQTAPAQAIATDATAKEHAFEVASIKPSKSGDSGSDSNFNHSRFTAKNIQLKTLMQYNAFGIPAAQIVGGPPWLNSDRFDIDARVDDAVVEQMVKLSREERTLWRQQMFQQLLADRFKLAFHWEMKEFPVYALVVAKNGPKIKPLKNAITGTSTSAGNGNLTARGVTMEKLAQTLTQELARELGRIVIDKTGLEGNYDVKLTWSPDDSSATTTDISNGNATPAGPSIFTAIQEQLGLKLESTKASVKTLVIDHIEQPSEN